MEEDNETRQPILIGLWTVIVGGAVAIAWLICELSGIHLLYLGQALCYLPYYVIVRIWEEISDALERSKRMLSRPFASASDADATQRPVNSATLADFGNPSSYVLTGADTPPDMINSQSPTELSYRMDASDHRIKWPRNTVGVSVQALRVKARLEKAFGLDMTTQFQVQEPEKMHGAITEVENCTEVTYEQARITELHIILKQITIMRYLPEQDQYRYQQRAQDLIDQWGFSFVNDSLASSSESEPSPFDRITHSPSGESFSKIPKYMERTPEPPALNSRDSTPELRDVVFEVRDRITHRPLDIEIALDYTNRKDKRKSMLFQSKTIPEESGEPEERESESIETPMVSDMVDRQLAREMMNTQSTRERSEATAETEAMDPGEEPRHRRSTRNRVKGKWRRTREMI